MLGIVSCKLSSTRSRRSATNHRKQKKKGNKNAEARKRGIYKGSGTMSDASRIRRAPVGSASNLNVVFLGHKVEVRIVAVGADKLIDFVRVDIVAVDGIIVA